MHLVSPYLFCKKYRNHNFISLKPKSKISRIHCFLAFLILFQLGHKANSQTAFLTQIQVEDETVYKGESRLIHLNSAYYQFSDKLVKFDSNGKLIWSKKNPYELINAFENSDGSINLCLEDNYGESEILIAQIDSEGKINELKSYQGLIESIYYLLDPSDAPELVKFGMSPIRIIKSNDGGMIIAGTAILFSSSDLVVVKLDKKGKIKWSKLYRTPNEMENIKLFSTVNGSICISGGMDDQGILMNLDIKKGALNWAMITDTNSSYLELANSSENGLQISYYSSDSSCYAIAKLNFNGEVIWTKNLKMTDFYSGDWEEDPWGFDDYYEEDYYEEEVFGIDYIKALKNGDILVCIRQNDAWNSDFSDFHKLNIFDENGNYKFSFGQEDGDIFIQSLGMNNDGNVMLFGKKKSCEEDDWGELSDCKITEQFTVLDDYLSFCIAPLKEDAMLETSEAKIELKKLEKIRSLDLKFEMKKLNPEFLKLKSISLQDTILCE